MIRVSRLAPVLILCLAIGGTVRSAAQTPPPPPPPPTGSTEDEVFLYEEIDQRPRMLPGAPIFYPAEPTATTGKVVLTLVVNADGMVAPGTIRVVSSPDSALTAAARAIVVNARYRPGKLKELPIRVLMRQELRFKPITLPCDSVVVQDGVRLCSLPGKGGSAP
ncbi:MAG: TonB family protein [Gemmatimonadales bacterium]